MKHLSLALMFMSLFSAPLGAADKPASKDDQQRNAADALMRQAYTLGLQTRTDEAIAVYRRVIHDFPSLAADAKHGGGLYKTRAQGTIDVLECRKAGMEFSAPAAEDVLKAIRSAVESGSAAKLVALATCDFVVGMTGSPKIQAARPDRVASFIIELARPMNWSQVQIATDARRLGSFDVTPKGGGALVRFGLRKNDRNSWEWAAFLVTTDAQYSKFGAVAGKR